MSDYIGSVTDPAAVPGAGETVTDHLLDVLLAFCSAVLRAKIGAAWAAVTPGNNIVEAVYPFDPETESFIDKALPALFAHRIGGKPFSTLADEYGVEEDIVVLRWVFPPTAQARSRLRAPIISGWAKLLHDALYQRRDPAYVDPSDTDPLSPSHAAAPTSIALAHATSTAPQTLSGAGLNGAVGAGAISPRRGVTVTLEGSPADFVDGSTVTIVGLNGLGTTISAALTITAASVPYTMAAPCDFASVTSAALDAQATTSGSWSVGTAARAGYGSPLLESAGAMAIWPVKPPQPKPLIIKPKDSTQTLAAKTYHMIELQLGVRERLVRDPAKYPLLGSVSDDIGAGYIDVLNPDGRTDLSLVLPSP
jgi:hypothetical protein